MNLKVFLIILSLKEELGIYNNYEYFFFFIWKLVNMSEKEIF